MASLFPDSSDDYLFGTSQLSDDQAVFTGTCCVCNETFDKTDLYRCLTCHSAVNDQEEVCQNSDGSMIYETFCENCIVGPHLRQKHEIIDHKGYTPAICNKHKILSRLFCKDCRIDFCSSCVIVHKNHDFISVSEKSTWRQIFDYLIELEQVRKPVQHQKDVVIKSMEEITKSCNVFTEQNVANSLSDIFKRVIEENVPEWQERENFEKKKRISVSTEASRLPVEAARENERVVESLRSLLLNPDEIRQEFSDIQKTFEDCLEKQNTTLQRHFYLEWCQNVEEIVKSLIRDFFGRIKSPEMMSIVYKSVILNSESVERTENHVDWNEINYKSTESFSPFDFGFCELLSVTYGLGYVEFSVLHNKNPRDKQNLTIAAYNFHNCTAKKLIKDKSFIAFLLQDQLVRIYCLKKNSFIHELNLPEVLEPLDFYLKTNGSFVFFAWNNSKSGIELLNYAGKTLFNCESKPKLFKNFGSVSAIVYPNNDVVVYKWTEGIKIQICKLHHGLSQIDRVFMEEKSLKLFDYRLGISLEGRIDFAFPNVSFRLTEVVDMKSQGSIFDCIVTSGANYYVISDGKLFVGKTEDSDDKKILPILTNLFGASGDSIVPRKCDQLPSSLKSGFQSVTNDGATSSRSFKPNQDTRSSSDELENFSKPFGVSQSLNCSSEAELKRENIKREVCAIMNKLTPDNFSILSAQMAQLDIDTDEQVSDVIDIVFEKACLEPLYAETYANLCKTVISTRCRNHKQNESSSNPKDPMVALFRRELLKRCQQEFQKKKDCTIKLDEKKSYSGNSSEEEEQGKVPEKFEKLKLDFAEGKRKSLANNRFIGELFKLDLLTEPVMHSCIESLLKNSKDEDSLECMCQLLTIIGGKLDNETGRNSVDHYFKSIRNLAVDREISPRIRFMLQGVIELRANKWQSNKASGPKTIAQVHKEAREEDRQMRVQAESIKNRNRRLQKFS